MSRADLLKFTTRTSRRENCDIDIAVIGATGRVGTRVVSLIASRQREWAMIGARPRIVFAANSRAATFAEAGIDDVASALAEPNETTTRSAWRHLQTTSTVSIIVDCTASADIAARYPEWLARGIDIVTPNKHASSGDAALTQAIGHAQASTGADLRDSTTVGAQLPLLSTLRELRQAGDRVQQFEAVLSGTLSYVLGSVQSGASLSGAIGEAISLGFAEPDPAADLSGEDAARKLVILLRAAGVDIELADVERVPLLDTDGDWFAAASRADESWRARAAIAEARHERWVYRASYEGGRARVAPERIAADHPLARLAPCENALVLRSDLYRVAPLTVAGPGAGIELTAAGVFGDLLAAARSQASRQIASSPVSAGLKRIANSPLTLNFAND